MICICQHSEIKGMIKKWLCAYVVALDEFIWAEFKGEIPNDLQGSELVVFTTYNGNPPPYLPTYKYGSNELGIQICGSVIFYKKEDKYIMLQNAVVRKGY